VSQSFRVVSLAVLALLAVHTTSVSAFQEDPDSVVQIRPILVRVLGSAIGTQAPYPISVIAGSDLTRGTASAFLEDAMRAVPGVQIHNRYNLAVGERVAVRGFGSRSQFGVRGVRILVDGIPATLPDGQATLDHLDLAGLGRVEVLRGPNAALYGNAAGGVLHFRSIDPKLVPASVALRTTGGSHGLWTTQASATGTAGTAGYRVGFTRTEFDGFRQDPEADDGSAYGAATRSVLNSTLSLPVGQGTLRFVANAVDLDAENPGSLNATVLGEGNRAAHGFNVRSGAIKDVQQGQLGASWSGQMGSTEAEFAMWGIRRELYNPIPGRVIDLKRNAGGIRTLLQRSSDLGDVGFSYGAGFEVELQSDDRLNFGSDGGSPTDLRLDQHERVRGAGLFVQGRLDFTSRVSLLAGLRYDEINFSVDDNFVAGDPDDSGARAMDAVSPSLGIVVGAIENVEFFGTIGRSFETPTTTELANQPSGAGGFNPNLEPQTGLTIEGGVRATVAQQWGMELSVFRTKLENSLVPFEVAGGAGRTYFRNAGESVHNGWELSLDGRILPGLSTRIAYTNIDAAFVAFATDTDDFSGNKIPGLAPQRLDGLITFDRGVGFVELRGLWQDDVPVDDAGLTSSPSYFIADVRVGLDDMNIGRVNVAPFFGIANAFDKTYNSSVVPNAFGSRYFEPGPGRTYRFGLGVGLGN
jgi:iron complex outermembrane receptor protein